MDVIRRNGWLSTNPDSVDNLPSLHFNLVTDGIPKFHQGGDYDDDDDDDDDGNGSGGDNNSSKSYITTDQQTGYNFPTCVRKIYELLQKPLYDQLLSTARAYTNSSTVQISEVFVRSYGQDLQPSPSSSSSRRKEDEEDEDEDGGIVSSTRYGISAHYDVFSSLTAVIALDDVASKGDSGLFTFDRSEEPRSQSQPRREGFATTTTGSSNVSKHPSLRRYFPLDAGDCVLHSWDVLHGVDINPAHKRTSLVVWFTDYGENNDDDDDDTSDPVIIPPWLDIPHNEDDVGNFVLATAIESIYGESSSFDIESIDSTQSDNSSVGPHDLYLKSASQGNAFGLCRLGSLCDDKILSPSLLSLIGDMLYDLNSESSERQNLHGNNDFLRSICQEQQNNDFQAIAKGLWFEAAMRGDLLAQLSLAAACMEDFTSSAAQSAIEEEDDSIGDQYISRNEDDILIAAILFSFAAQQGDEEALGALSRILNIHRSYFMPNYDQELFDDEAFLNTPISRTIMVGANLI